MSEPMCSCAGFCKGRDGLSDRYICGLERKPGKVFTPRDAKKSQPAPQEPSDDTLQAVREVYRDDLDAMADSLLRLRADLAETRRELARHQREVQMWKRFAAAEYDRRVACVATTHEPCLFREGRCTVCGEPESGMCNRPDIR